MVQIPLLCAGSIVVDINIQNLPRFPQPDLEFTERSDVWHDAPARLLIGGTACNAAIVYAELRGGCELAGPGDDVARRIEAFDPKKLHAANLQNR